MAQKPYHVDGRKAAKLCAFVLFVRFAYSNIGHKGVCLFRRPDFDDFEIYEVVPVCYPFLEQLEVVAFHQLETPVEVCLNPTVDIFQTFRCHAAPLAKPFVDHRGIAVFETFNHYI